MRTVGSRPEDRRQKIPGQDQDARRQVGVFMRSVTSAQFPAVLCGCRTTENCGLNRLSAKSGAMWQPGPISCKVIFQWQLIGSDSITLVI